MKPGKFISIEGLEGAGKTTQAERLASWLNSKEINFVRTREPGGTEIAEKIRGLVLDHHEEPMNPTTELLLVFAARKQHVESLIKPALAAGKWVLSDRFTDATYAYQGGGRQLSLNLISALEKTVLDGFQPDLTLWFDCDAQTGLQRARARGALDRIETEKTDFFERCRAGYQSRFDQNPDRFLQLDASQSVDDVTESMLSTMESWYE